MCRKGWFSQRRSHITLAISCNITLAISCNITLPISYNITLVTLSDVAEMTHL